jgi:hypothetical protein
MPSLNLPVSLKCHLHHEDPRPPITLSLVRRILVLWYISAVTCTLSPAITSVEQAAGRSVSE